MFEKSVRTMIALILVAGFYAYTASDPVFVLCFIMEPKYYVQF